MCMHLCEVNRPNVQLTIPLQQRPKDLNRSRRERDKDSGTEGNEALTMS